MFEKLVRIRKFLKIIIFDLINDFLSEKLFT